MKDSKSVKYPCRGCIYFSQCGDNERTEPCDGRRLNRDLDKGRRGEI